MSVAAPPIVPTRPVRAQQAAELGASHLPEIPPRPKRLERSISPGNYPRSPLNEPYGGALSRQRSLEPSSLNPLPRTPSVQNLPSIGQEGNEYADIQYTPQVPASALAADAAAQTRNVAEDLHLHAPKPSLPKSSATAQVQAVTKTDSHLSSSPGFGKPGTPSHDEYDPLQRLKSKSSFSRPGSQASTERRRSIVYGDEQGPAELGMRVPINPLLGDVQAPSPAPFGSALTPTHTGHNGEPKRRHSRTKSGREVFLPPGSYGLHGHGVPSQDRFEKDWYSKHPEQLQHEEGHGHGVYESIGSGRGNYAMSSDDLNKIVRDTASRGAGFGTSGNTLSYPDEQIGYMASEQYASRSHVASPNYLTKMHSNSSQPPMESPLRKASFPADDEAPQEFRKSKDFVSGKSDEVMESENEEPVHVTEPQRRYNKVTGGEETMRETEDAVPYSHPTEEGGLADEHGYHAPILASDEVAKEVGGDFMHPAVSPRMDRRGSAHEYEHRSSGDVTPSSRPVSRPGSIYGMHSLNHSLSRFVSHHDENRENMHTPLEDVDEYEPLFPDEDSKQKAMNTTDRFKPRPDTLKHRFPSQDIWEDTPSSAMYVATVSTPDLPAQTEGHKKPEAKTLFEHPDAEASRKGEPSEEEKKRLVPAEERLAKSRFAPHLREDMPTRPGMQPRFPSQDIWEDSPDSQYLVTTVQYPPVNDETQKSPTEAPAKPTIPPRPAPKSKLSSEISPPTPPSVPARPQKRMHAVPPVDAKLTEVSIPPNEPASKEPSPTEIRKVPSIPDRPKPQIPPRPAKQSSLEGLSKTLSSASAGSAASTETEKASAVASPPLSKPKPQVPARPAQTGKFAALKGNFLNDLNQKLGVGPPKEKEAEPEPEVEQQAKPLGDARKGRARGPQRRAPAKSPSAAAEPSSMPTHSIFAPKALWHISSDDGLLNVMTHSDPEKTIDQTATSEESNVKPPPPVLMSEEKIVQMDNSTVADAPPAPTLDTTVSRPEGEAKPMEPTGFAINSAGEVVDPSSVTPSQEKPNRLDKLIEESGEGASLSQHTTASSGAMSGHSLERAEPDPSTDAIPISQHTTADSSLSGDTLAKAETKAEPEKIELRDEQVSAPAPGVVAPQTAKQSSVSGQGSPEEDIAKDVAAGADKPREPSGEDDVDYKKLEEMTARADGKGHAAEEEGLQARKVMD